ncbi:MAG TPA: phosphatidate cytidylyltransferase [Desulfobulbus sp.]|nr:phosphatidate cytidylyltransferase [Desulfobulbus sp.]
MGRVFPGIAMAAGWILLLAFAPVPLFWLCIVLVTGRALFEFSRMTGLSFPGQPPGLLAGVILLPVLASLAGTAQAVAAGLAGGLIGLVFLVLRRYSSLDNVLEMFSLAIMGLVYISFCGAHVVLIRHLEHGVAWLLVLTAITAASDTGAYYAGRAFGKKKLCPAISPGKTVAGGIGGLAGGVVLAVLAGLVLLPTVHPLWLGLVAALLVVIGITGDLAESVIKRATGCKDSGTILAGHGGLLDRVDSILLTAPVLYYLLVFGLVA